MRHISSKLKNVAIGYIAMDNGGRDFVPYRKWSDLMSRYTIPSHNPLHLIEVGWDKPMTTYFGQVMVPAPADSDEDDKTLLWVGGIVGEITSVQMLAKAIADYAEIPADIAAMLKNDRLKDIDSGPTVLQRQLLGLSRRNAIR